ncbi:uncharacterized protein B0H18DRAFT_1086079 [Fomitopsis serialis]|uniref:uncharacterized protein n=1 Tax=Fomitopsis serialis TaxID=139415 RepID=UPI00200800EC|nr:uncharacterized protein B0H18DRAFT_1086079 [Neoantrodia serialis]KAH9921628.1 hypothetical protein B0H18DRAFT_1086079 [Neoantrodia serialis]
MDSVRSLARLPTLRLSAGSLSFSFLKYIVVFLFLANARSWPLSWHFRVFKPALAMRLRWYMLQFRLLLKPTHAKRGRRRSGWRSYVRSLVQSVACAPAPDDSDFNLHLSNSCYAKVRSPERSAVYCNPHIQQSLDCVRLGAALKCFPTLFRADGWMALGATHYNFLREIPIFSPYEVRARIAGWDNKWVYIVARYVTHPRKKSKKAQKVLPANGTPTGEITPSATPPTDSNGNAHTGGAPYPVLHTPADPIDSETNANDSGSGSGSPDGDAHVVAEALTRASTVHVEPDGATLNCVIVNALCFKIGRITIPPALALAVEGFCTPGEVQYSPSSPPPFWAEVQKLRGEDPTDLRKLQKLYAGGWRDVPEDQRWWEKALEGLEERRKVGMEVVGALRRGMEGVRSL